MSVRKRLFTAAAMVAALAVAGVLGTAPTASAASVPLVEAQATYIYLYEHDNFKGGSWRTSGSDSNLAGNCWSGSGCRSVNDNASSMKNQKSSNASFYEHANYKGPSYYAQKNSSDKDLTDNGFDNKISSVRVW
ncbi:peptidase inhibitor family I36 protein [Nocardiopsis sp. B62]|uniref:peptidase inhibitor family I36 protein n=1 Tax=Nocardiopsis sp. B62 TaxID=2824874 RepID=UPI001B394FF4|nr:peptidase inhibitor family I36 protein [Nocardiopsis sp. B62]MBQ1082067.1 peptidase inhibitor family I36 protein [Nocardiopsis sp. B62]